MRYTVYTTELNQQCLRCLNGGLLIDHYPHSRRIYCSKCGYTVWVRAERERRFAFLRRKKPR